MDDQMTPFAHSAENGDPVLRNKLIRKMAASYIRHQLYIGATSLKLLNELSENRIGQATLERGRIADHPAHLTVTALGVEGTGPTIDAALRHWCELVEGEA